MTTLVVPWLAFPLVLLALTIGCGLLVEHGAGGRLPGALVLPVGFGALVVVALFTTSLSATAPLTMPVTCVVAAAGYVVAVRARRRPWADWWAVGAGLGVFAVYAAPVVLSGRATFPGYIKLDDDSTFLANLDRVMEHARDISGLEPSSFLATLQPHLAKGYPLGSVLPIGVGQDIVGGDTLWLYHPCVAFTAAMLGLTLYRLASTIVARRWLAALAGFIAAQSALLYGYAMWGGLKEVAGAAAIALVAALVWPALRPEPTVRSFLPLAVAAAWLLGVLSSGAALWLLPGIGVAFAVALLGRKREWNVAIAGFAALIVALAIPTLVAAPSFLANRVFEFDYLANLVRPLKAVQLAGIWPTGDFRVDPAKTGLAYALIAVACLAAAAGVAWAVRRRSWAIPLYVVGALVSCFAFFPFVTPWIEGKALAMASPAVPLAALVVCGPLIASGRRVEGAMLAAVVAGGVLWSNVLQYHDVWLAPRAQLAELDSIGSRFAGEGPALMTEFQPYGVRHLLRNVDAEGASELRIRPIYLRTGDQVGKGGYANIDDFALDSVLTYRTLVLRRSPLESRPPSSYRLVDRGRFYDVWQRPEQGSRQILEHVPLGSPLDPTAVADCADVLRLAREAGPQGALAAVVRPQPVVSVLSSASVPAGWGADSSGALVPAGSGTVEATVAVPETGRYGLWLGGSFRDPVHVSVDGKPVESVRAQLNNFGQYTPLGEIVLERGSHTVGLRFDGSSLRPGSGGAQFAMGPLVLERTSGGEGVTRVTRANARLLCGRRLDWVEAIRP